MPENSRSCAWWNSLLQAQPASWDSSEKSQRVNRVTLRFFPPSTNGHSKRTNPPASRAIRLLTDGPSAASLWPQLSPAPSPTSDKPQKDEPTDSHRSTPIKPYTDGTRIKRKRRKSPSGIPI